VVKLAYRYALDPSPAQERALRSHARAARFAWNWGPARAGSGTRPSGGGTPPPSCTNCGTRRRKPTRRWAGGQTTSKCCYQESFRNLDRALSDFVKSRKGRRKGKRLGFHRYKKRRKARDSFRLAGVIRCQGSTVTGPIPASALGQAGAAGRRPGWRGCTPALPASAPTRCTRPARCSPDGTRRWWPRT